MIRLAALTDADEIQAIYAPIVRDTVISFEYEPPSVEEVRKRIANILAAFPWLVLEDDGKVAAYAYASAHKPRAAYQWAVDVSIYVSPQSHRRGYGRTLYKALFDVLRAQGYYTAYAGVTLPNDGSVGLHEAMGFRPIGVYKNVGFKFGDWRDVGWWSLPLREYDQSPLLPRRLKDLETSGEFPDLLNGLNNTCAKI